MNLSFLERAMLLGILNTYKDVVKLVEQNGGFAGGGITAREAIRMTDYFIEKLESPDKNEINLDELLDRRNL